MANADPGGPELSPVFADLSRLPPLLLLAGVHAAAALMHHYLFEDRTLLRMLPGVSPPVRRRAKARGAPPVSP